ncbi:MAG: hypothetical protein HYV37_00230 [Candidatus Levyibacteriota bacterium]|nr:MAG: hypothetical protein HYV37_00230 [Candidatus Levybacteria bacterium]
MKITTKSIIKALPFEEQFRLDLINKLDSLSADQKFTIEQILWDAYFSLYDLKMDTNLKLALERAKNNEETLDKDFYKRVEAQTEKEMENQAVEATERVDLTAARKAMELIVKEIQESKK